MKKFCGKTVVNIFCSQCALDDCVGICESVVVFVCMFQVGDHHPDLYVWTLYNHHEVSLCFCSYFQPKATTCFIRTTGSIFMCCALWRFNRSLCCLVERHCSRAGQPCLSGLRRTTAVGNAGDGDNDMVPLKPGEKGRVCTCACTSKTGKSLPSLWAASSRPSDTV